MSQVHISLFNFVAVNNAHIQNEMRGELQMASSLNVFQLSRKLQKLNITRKRLSLIPVERNTSSNIDARSIYVAEIFRFPRKT